MSGTTSLPSGWKELVAGELMPGSGPSVNPAKFPDEQFDLYSIPAFDAGVPVTTLGAEIGSSKQVVTEGDVLLSKIVPHIRRAWVVGRNVGRRQIASSEWIVFRSDHAYPGYLRHFLVSDRFHVQFMNTVSGVGGSLMRARPAFVAQISVPLPPLSEQRRIAGILDAADGLRAKRRESIALLDTLTQSIFHDMFGDPSHLDQVSLSDLAEVQGGLTVNSKRSLLPLRAPYLRVANVARGSIDLTEVKEIGVSDREVQTLALRLDDLLLVEGHGNRTEVGRVARWTETTGTYVHQNHLIRVRLQGSRVLPGFAEHYLNGPGGRAQVACVAKTTSGLNTIAISQVRDLKVPIPPAVQQRDFTERMADLTQQKATAMQALRELDALFASLQSRAFRGEL